jgi:hypothetical protein
VEAFWLVHSIPVFGIFVVAPEVLAGHPTSTITGLRIVAKTTLGVGRLASTGGGGKFVEHRLVHSCQHPVVRFIPLSGVSVVVPRGRNNYGFTHLAGVPHRNCA